MTRGKIFLYKILYLYSQRKRKIEIMATIADAGDAKRLCGPHFNFTFFYRISERRRNLGSHQNVFELTGASFDVTSL